MHSWSLDTLHHRRRIAVEENLLEAEIRMHEEQAAAHWKEFWQHALRVETPDPQVNQAIAWAEVALDQAWVCNTDLGCGFVAHDTGSATTASSGVDAVGATSLALLRKRFSRSRVSRNGR